MTTIDDIFSTFPQAHTAVKCHPRARNMWLNGCFTQSTR